MASLRSTISWLLGCSNNADQMRLGNKLQRQQFPRRLSVFACGMKVGQAGSRTCSYMHRSLRRLLLSRWQQPSAGSSLLINRFAVAWKVLLVTHLASKSPSLPRYRPEAERPPPQICNTLR